MVDTDCFISHIILIFLKCGKCAFMASSVCNVSLRVFHKKTLIILKHKSFNIPRIHGLIRAGTNRNMCPVTIISTR